MSAEKETVQVYVVFGFQITRVSDTEGELVTTEYAPGQEVELEAEIAREEEHRNRVRIIRPEPAVVAEPVAVAEPVVEAEPETPVES